MRRVLALIPIHSRIEPSLTAALASAELPSKTLVGCSDIVYARSTLLSDALNEDAEVFVFVDADMCPTADHLRRLANSDRVDARNAVTGCYSLSSGMIAAVRMDGRPVEAPDLGAAEYLECAAAGMGFAAVHRSTIELVREDLPEIQESSGYQWHPYFLPFVAQLGSPDVPSNLVYYPEDFAFWYRIRTVSNAHLWADTTLQVGHAKSSVLTPNAPVAHDSLA